MATDYSDKDYLGNGVYVHYDGYSIQVRANDFENPTDQICFEPNIVEAFIRFAKRMGVIK